MARIDKMKWELCIEAVENGYLLKGFVDGKNDKTFIVEEGIDDPDQDQETMVRLLYSIKEYFGVYASKHNKKNCRIILEETK